MEIIFTVCNRNTLANAVVLAESVAKYMPTTAFHIGWVDSVPFPSTGVSAKVWELARLDIAGFDAMAARYRDFELVCALRPWFADKICEAEIGLRRLTFLAPTTRLYTSLDVIWKNEDAAVLLTPNLTAPLRKDARLDDKRILNIGMYNAAAWSLKPSDETRKMLGWWKTRTYDRAHFDLCHGQCMDQLWLNYAPIWIPSAKAVANPGWCYGLGAVVNHKLVESNAGYVVNGKPLLLADFNGVTAYDPVWSDHVSLANEHPAYRKLLTNYRSDLANAARRSKTENKPGYGIVTKISENRLLRRSLAQKLRALSAFVDRV